MMFSDCKDCNRTEYLRRAVAEAGRGLPEIEPGMPLPAGTGLTRRSFVSRTAGLALAVYGGGALTSFAFEDGIARAASEAAATNKVLLSVFLAGGIDGLNVLFPAGDPKYYALRPNLALGQTTGIAYTGDSRLRWHPAMSSIATLYGEGKVSVIPAIGYANSDQSHFTSRHYWEVGATDATLRTGWLGRYLDKTGTARQPAPGALARCRAAAGARDDQGPGRDAPGGRSVHVRRSRCRSAPPRVVDPPGGRESGRCPHEVA